MTVASMTELVPSRRVSTDVPRLTPCKLGNIELHLHWTDLLQVQNDLDGPVVVVANAIPVRVIAWGLIDHFGSNGEPKVTSIESLAGWLMEEKGLLKKRENTHSAISYVKENWHLRDSQATVAVLYIRHFPKIIESNAQQEKEFIRKAIQTLAE